MADSSPPKTLNFNFGVLGHVDSGKTCLAHALSSIASTAAFDKNPQSKERGITLDPGFSEFTAPLGALERILRGQRIRQSTVHTDGLPGTCVPHTHHLSSYAYYLKNLSVHLTTLSRTTSYDQ
ncbi:selenocysteine-specific elongation factor-like [Carassius auratus]|uniref:Selenocysteine-specific elongation factor-like n=1 Tax=Carassius auratus TaxID=7957 RepID=A0A6P6KDV3_CARAU|nr:selenocysteine-specific elongation factor-like [Carassius auratus]